MKHRKPKTQPESLAANRLLKHMRAREWTCWKVGAGKYVSGWPDYYCYHRLHGHRWIETKINKNMLEPSQIKRFQELTDAGDKVFVLTDETHYGRLFKEPNWLQYVRGLY